MGVTTSRILAIVFALLFVLSSIAVACFHPVTLTSGDLEHQSTHSITALNNVNIEVVEEGDTINVDWVGALTDGRVFGTSNYSIAINDIGFPKSLSFTLQDQSKYKPITFKVGSGNLINGFESAVVGMQVGETKTATLSPDQAYGEMDETRLVTFNLTEEVPKLLTITLSEFESAYESSPIEGTTVTNPYYGWTAIVLEYDNVSDLVTIKNTPTNNSVYHIFGDSLHGWNALVSIVDNLSNAITIVHQLTDLDSDFVMGIDKTGTFIITQVNNTDNTAVRNYNSELLGKNLVFTITINSIITEPYAPTNLGSIPGIDTISLNWAAPVNDGGSRIISYKIYCGLTNNSKILISNINTTHYVIDGLQKGTIYYCTVRAVNEVGESPYGEILMTTTLTLLTGNIVNENGEPLNGITIKLENGTSTTSGVMGTFELLVNPGYHTLTISGSNINTRTILIDVASDGIDVGMITTSESEAGEPLTTYAIIIIAIAVVSIALMMGLSIMKKRK